MQKVKCKKRLAEETCRYKLRSCRSDQLEAAELGEWTGKVSCGLSRQGLGSLDFCHTRALITHGDSKALSYASWGQMSTLGLYSVP